MTQYVGNPPYESVIATLSDNASIVEAFKYYHTGGITGSIYPNSIQQYLIDINKSVSDTRSAIGYSSYDPINPSLTISARLSSLESIVGTSLSSTYIKMIPSSNDNQSTRNYIVPSASDIVPLAIQGVVGQTANLQEWRSTAGILARIDSAGRIYSYDGTSTAEVATISGSQTLANKTLTNPISTIGSNQQSASYSLILSDQSKIIEMSGGGTLTIPTDSVAFPIGTYIVILQTGINQVTIAGASGVTVLATPGLKMRTQYSMATLIKRGSNSWIVAGDVTA